MGYYTALIVEDDAQLKDAMSETLKLSGYNSLAVSNISDTLSALNVHQFGIVILDLNLSKGENGLKLLSPIKITNPNLPVLVVTAFGSIENAVKVIKQGVVDYLAKPFLPEHLVSLVQRYAIKPSTESMEDSTIVVNNKVKKIFAMAQRVAATQVTVLLMGESGTGKEVLAKHIHAHSKLSDGPFIDVNCAAIPENMLEAILFGYEKGAYTGAYNANPGKFELAQNGTIFLDEISEMPANLQAKILRVIQEKQVERLGGKKAIDLNIRIISATNKNLKEEVALKNFREDLYYRLNVFPLTLPPLRERSEDILPIANSIIHRQCAQEFDNQEVTLSKGAEKYLLSRKWVGNIRELENVIQRALVMKNGNIIEQEDLTLGEIEEIVSSSSNSQNVLQGKEHNLILEILHENNGCRKATAEKLGISTRTLRYKLSKMRKQGIIIPEIYSTKHSKH